MPASYNNKPRSYSIVFASLKCHKSFRLFLAHPFMIYALSAPLTSCLKDRIAYSCMQHIMKWLLMKGLTSSKLCNELELNWNKFQTYIWACKTVCLSTKKNPSHVKNWIQIETTEQSVSFSLKDWRRFKWSDNGCRQWGSTQRMDGLKINIAYASTAVSHMTPLMHNLFDLLENASFWDFFSFFFVEKIDCISC